MTGLPSSLWLGGSCLIWAMVPSERITIMRTRLNPADLAAHLISEKAGDVALAIAELTKALNNQRWISSDMIDVLEETREILRQQA